MATVKYSLDEFIHDMEALLKEQPDQHRIFDKGSSYLEKLIANPAAIPEEYLVPVGQGARGNHGSYALYQGDSGLLVTSVVWGPGDHASPHDHGTWGMIGVMGNHLTETRFRRVDDRAVEGIRHAGEGPQRRVCVGGDYTAHSRGGRNSPDGQLYRPPHRGNSRLRRRPAGPEPLSLQPGNGQDYALCYGEVRQLLGASVAVNLSPPCYPSPVKGEGILE